MAGVLEVIDWRWWLKVVAVSAVALGAGFALGMWLGNGW